MAFFSGVAVQKCRKRRRSYYDSNRTYVVKNPTKSHSLTITLLLALLAVTVQGESRTLRHYRSRQHDDATGVFADSLSSGVLDQRTLKESTGTIDEKRHGLSQKNNNEDIIFGGLFLGSGGTDIEGDHQYGIGKQHGIEGQLQSINTYDDSEKIVPLLSTQTETVERNDIDGTSEDRLKETTVDDMDRSKTQIDVGEDHKSIPIVKYLFGDPEERDVLHYYAIGNGKQNQIFDEDLPSQSQSNTRNDYLFENTIINDGSECLVSDFECCSNADCIHDDDICVHRNCIIDGNFRFTLSWIGDDDYDLFVVTPDRQEISYDKEFDPVSLGKFDKGADQGGYGFHLENIYFPVEGGPSGVYRFFVRPFATVGESDEWTVTVMQAGNLVTTKSGFGSSESFFCNKENHQPAQPPTISPSFYVPTQSPFSIAPPSIISPTAAPVIYPNRPPLGQEPTRVPNDLSPSLPTTVTKAPDFNDQGCDTASGDECCLSSDCENPQDICEQRTCIKNGIPRFTLIWSGDADPNLFVITPDGVQISRNNTYDAITGGRYEQVGNGVASSGKRIENIYFATKESPNGKYEYGVIIKTDYDESDSWTINIYDENGLVDSNTGSEDSETFTYSRQYSGDLVDDPQRPKPQPPPCSSREEQCCTNADCIDSTGGLCIQRACIHESPFRITLEWIGDDNLDLYVETPISTIISNSFKFDIDSGGRFESSKQSNNGFNVESIYFPASGAPLGVYRIYINPKAIAGVGSDLWTLRVFEDGKKKLDETGFGNSNISYELVSLDTLAPTTTPPTPTNPPTTTPTSNPQDIDLQVCIESVCVSEGNPRFTLRWPGESFYSLVVVTPGGKQISSFAPFDADSGGVFEGPTRHLTDDDDVESVYFPIAGGPLGSYTYYVKNIGGGDLNESWTVSVHVNGKSVAMETGSGSSDSFFFQFEELSDYQCETSKNKCCQDADCSFSEICSNNACLRTGAPQFVLSWEGNHDVALSVVTPRKTTISWQFPLDLETGGEFNEYFDFENNRRIENIYFAPDEGPLGLYPYYIHSFENDDDNKNDTWKLSIYVNGQEISSENGQGSSEVLYFDYIGNHSIGEVPDDELPNDDVNEEVPDKEVCDQRAISDGECCSDSDCFPNEACTSRNCVDEGNPRFTLSWTGKNDLDLFVVTPLETFISYSKNEDSQSGGKFGEDFNQFEYGSHVENVYFPIEGGPTGEYKFYVKSFLPDENQDDEWTVGVYVDGEEQFSFSGIGSSPELTYDFSPPFL